MRNGEWKLVRPAIREAMHVPDIHWLKVSMYEPEHFIANGIMRDPEPPRDVPEPPPPELYNIVTDPLEQNDLARTQPDLVYKMQGELETWFEEVEVERASISDEQAFDPVS